MVTDPISYTNPNGTDDIESPRVKSVMSQPKDNSEMSCSWNPDGEAGPGPGDIALSNIKSQLRITDDSMSSAAGQTSTDADAILRYIILDSNGDGVDTLRLYDNGESIVDGNTKTFVLEDIRDYLRIDTTDSTQFILQLQSLQLYDAAGNRTLYEGVENYANDVKYPSASSIYENIDLRDHCNFNLGNNAPVFSNDSAFTINEGETTITTVTASDADGDVVSYNRTSDGDSSLFTIDSTTGALSFTTSPDYEAPEDSDTNNTYAVTITATDGFNTSEQVISVTVANINDNSPTFTSSGSLSVNENQRAIVTVAASDADGDTVSYSLSGTDADALTINSSSGVLTFNSAPDFETKSSYSAVVTASDGTNASPQTLSISIINVNEFTPTFTSDATFTVNENETAIGTVRASDGDGDSLTFSISGSDININASSGVISFASAPDLSLIHI